jgi:Flp pilus assembly protein TadD
MAIEGALSDVGLADICQLLALGRHTGCLTVNDRSNFGYVYFEKGRIIHATVLNRPDRLGDLLVKNGVITREQLSGAMASQAQGSGKKLGQILVEMGALTQEAITRYVTLQIEEAVYYLFTWQEGSFHFDKDARPEADDALLVNLSADSLLMEGARRVDEWSVIEKKIKSMDMIFALDRDPREGEEKIELSEVLTKILPLLDGDHSVSEIVDESGQVEFEVAKAIYELVQPGFARQVGTRHKQAAEIDIGEGAGADQHLNLAEAFYRSGMVEDAERELKKAAELDPGNARVLSRLALIYLKQRQAQEAYRALDTIQGPEGLSYAVLRNQALALEMMGRFKEALEVLDAAQEMEGKDPGVLLARGIVELKAQQPVAAWATLQRYRVKLGDETPPARFFAYGVLAAAMAGDRERAVAVGREGLKYHSDDPAILVNLGAALERQGELDAAEALFLRAASEMPAPPQAHKNLGDLAYRRGDTAGARAHFEKAIKIAPMLGDDIYLKLGNLAYKEGDRDWALLLWRRAQDINPKNEVVRTNLELLTT